MKNLETKALAVGHIPSGLFIVCGNDISEKKMDGFLASWIQQVSFDPLLISLCIKPGRPAYDFIKSGKAFSINIVGEHDKSYLKYFWKGHDPNSNPFDEIPHTISDEGTILMNQAKSTLVCELVASSQPGDHEVIIARVLESYIADEKAKPVVHLRKSGLDY